MPRDDWYRNKSWSNEIEAAFFEKLARARSQRGQYIVIQAITLADTRPDIALYLVDYYFETQVDTFDDIRAHSARSRAYLAQGNVPAAIESYKRELSFEPRHQGSMSNAFLDYPFLVARERIYEEYEEALTILEESRDRVAFPLGRFMWNAAYALILAERGTYDDARTFAEAALEAADEGESEFRYHGELGLVDRRKETNVICKLNDICNLSREKRGV